MASFVKVRYIGPHDQVTIPLAGVEALNRGETFTVPPELADALLEQPDNYQAVADGGKGGAK